jgi:hypothetical protein
MAKNELEVNHNYKTVIDDFPKAIRGLRIPSVRALFTLLQLWLAI